MLFSLLVCGLKNCKKNSLEEPKRTSTLFSGRNYTAFLKSHFASCLQDGKGRHFVLHKLVMILKCKFKSATAFKSAFMVKGRALGR